MELTDRYMAGGGWEELRVRVIPASLIQCPIYMIPGEYLPSVRVLCQTGFTYVLEGRSKIDFIFSGNRHFMRGAL